MPLLIKEILETQDVVTYVTKRHILKQYKKAKTYILAGHFLAASLKKRAPTSANIWYFRINQQFRAIGYIQEHTFYIVDIDNHQN